MNVTKNVTMDLLEKGYVPVIQAVQDDRYSRMVELELYAGGEAWAVPEDAAVLVRYSKADGTCGEYDTLPDGSAAWEAEGNVLTLVLAPQVLTAAGPVKLAVTLVKEETQISSFAMLVNVQAEVGGEASEDYFHVTRFLPGPDSAEAGQFVRIAAVDEQGKVTAVEAADLVSGENAVRYTAQELADEERKQARENIGAVSMEEAVSALEGKAAVAEERNLLEGVTWGNGYFRADGAIGGPTNNSEAYTVTPVEVTPGGSYVLTFRIPSGFQEYGWFTYVELDAEGNFLQRVAYDSYNGDFSEYVVEDEMSVGTFAYTASEEAYGFQFALRTFVNRGGTTEEELAGVLAAAAERVTLVQTVAAVGCSRLLPEIGEADGGKTLTVENGAWKAELPRWMRRNQNMRSVNHRGYNTVAPENTLAAFRLSKKMGFDEVETDVSFTADGVAVLLHDAAVDRTSDGTGNISELTFEQVREMDFGSWKDTAYAGEQIPSFAEFLELCRRMGLRPYVEIKTPATQEQVEGLVTAVKRYGMLDRVTWITAAGTAYLEYVQGVYPAARLGLVCSAVTEALAASGAALKNGSNEVFLDVEYAGLTEDGVSLCVENGLGLEVWGLEDAEGIAEVDPYISGFTTDAVIAGEILCEMELG